MFLLENSCRQRMLVVVVEHRYDFLQDDRTVVKVFIYKMNSATGELDAVFKGLLLRCEAREGRQQRRMNLENAIRKGAHKLWREQPHVSGEANQFDAGSLEC